MRWLRASPQLESLLLVNYRPEYQHNWATYSDYAQILLNPLADESAERLLTVLLGSDSSLQPLEKMLIAQTHGNPFFLEESVRTLVETGAFTGEPGSYRLARPLPTIQIPRDCPSRDRRSHRQTFRGG